MDLYTILKSAVSQGASDVFIIAGRPVSFRTMRIIHSENESILTPSDTLDLLSQLYSFADNRDIDMLSAKGDDDFSVSLPDLARFRVSAFKQRGSLSAVIRVISFELPDFNALHIPPYLFKLAEANKGMVLITGPAGAGKSTTLACLIDHLNRSLNKHIITLEDPIEHIHKHNQSIVSQREINLDTVNYVSALRASLRQSPDVILLGEMRDLETMEVAMTAAETGHLLLSTLHTIGAANTIDRIIDVFPAAQQSQISVQLAMTLNAVVSQQLVPTVDGNVIPAFEIMTVNTAIRNLIREKKTHQIDGIIYSSAKEDMISMDSSLLNLYNQGLITKETALTYSTNPDLISRKLS